MEQTISIRLISPADNADIAGIIRTCLEEFGANKPGTVYFDKTTDHLYALFQQDRSVYYVAEMDGVLLGGGGIFPSEGLPANTCELVKMYLLPSARGMGIGAKIINACKDFAKRQGYSQIYIETMPELKKAIGVYEKFGFQYLDKPLGNTGHFGCDVWMLKEI